jgi:hypothetical protein
MEKQLLREFKIFEANDVEVVESDSGLLKMTGVIQKANTPNANNRIYPMALLKREDDNMQDSIKDRRALGELDHPDSPIVQLENTSHILSKTWWDDDSLLGEIEVLDTPKGKILASLIEAGVKLGISSRGLGSTTKTNEGYDMVEDDFNMICYDMVSNPSTSNAFMHLKENNEFMTLVSNNRNFHLEKILDEMLDLDLDF